MSYAKIVLNLAVEGPFDYLIPPTFKTRVKPGVRARVNFSNRSAIGYVVGLSAASRIKKIKPLIEVLDKDPVLDKRMLALTRQISNYFGCTWGEAIESALPQALRQGRVVEAAVGACSASIKTGKPEATLLWEPDNKKRWRIYLDEIRSITKSGRSVIILLIDLNAALDAKRLIESELRIPVGISYRGQPDELNQWSEIRNGQFSVVLGTRSAVFSPLTNLGLIIVDQEQDSVYKQEQTPHYHAREAAFFRAGNDGASLLLGSSAPSLESIYPAFKGKIRYIKPQDSAALPEIKLIDEQRRPFSKSSQKISVSKFLSDSIGSTLAAGGRTLIFLNRRGYSNQAACLNCGEIIRCPRCNINLTYYFGQNLLRCNYCNHKITAPKICPACNNGYIKYSGTGIERIENEASLGFPQAKIKRIDAGTSNDAAGADIYVATSSVIRHHVIKFDLIGVVAIDSSLNRSDFRSGEKAYALLIGLSRLTDKRMIIQTRLTSHHLFTSLIERDPESFYRQELKQRKQLGFPPYRHLILIKLRSKAESKVAEEAEHLFNNLKGAKKNLGTEVLSCNPGQPAKIRGKFYWQILITCSGVRQTVKFIKLELQKFRHSSIIVTVDVDPI